MAHSSLRTRKADESQYVAEASLVVSWIFTRCRGLNSLLHTGEVSGSNPDSETGYLDLGFLWFSSVPPTKCGHERFSPHPLQFIIYRHCIG